MPAVFVSYRRNDSAGNVNGLCGVLRQYLHPAYGDDAVFLDTSIPAGASWPEHLRAALRAAPVVLVVIGPKWLRATTRSGQRRIDQADDWVRQEIEEALAAGKFLIPVLLDGGLLPPADYLPASVQALSARQAFTVRHDHWDDDLRALAARVRSALGNAGPPPKEPGHGVALTRELAPVNIDSGVGAPCPYRGLDAFSEEHSSLFFGRTTFLKQLGSALKRTNFLALLGPSGSGKSSLLRAGLVPLLRRGSLGALGPCEVHVIRPAGQPFAELARVGLTRDGERFDLAVRERLERHAPQRQIALIFDQFEEVFLDCPAVVRGTFIHQLRTVLEDTPARVVIAMRDDFYSRFSAHARELLPFFEAGLKNVPPLDEEELTAIVVRPATSTGLQFEPPNLVQTIVADAIVSAPVPDSDGATSQSTILPLLESALTELWARRQDGRMTLGAYQAIGGMLGGLTRWADRAVYTLGEPVRDTARSVFTSLVRLGDDATGMPDTRRRVPLGQLASSSGMYEEVEHVVRHLTAARLLVTARDARTGAETVELIHEALLREWGLLQRWIRDDRAFLFLRQRLSTRTRDWQASARTPGDAQDEGGLLRGHDLEEAQRALTERAADLPTDVRLYIQTSREVRDREEAYLRQLRTDLESQAKSLRASEELLRKQQEELQQVNEELKHKATLLTEQNKKVEQKNAEVEAARQALEEQAAQLAVSTKYKGEFFANMNHEMRTPLNSLLILTKLLADNKEGNLTEKQVEFAETILVTGTDLLNLINDVLDLAKAEAGRMDVDPAEVHVVDVYNFAERLFRPVAEQRGLTYNVEILPGTPAALVTDGWRLNQVLKNLLSNAFKFTEHGRVTLTIHKAETGRRFGNRILDRAEAVIAFAVEDTGIGIPKDEQQRIFESFQQAYGTTSRRYGGTGLGLSISRTIAGLLGGEISVESRPMEGSTFTLLLPIESEAPNVSPTAAPGRFRAPDLSAVTSVVPPPPLIDGEERCAAMVHGSPADTVLQDKKVLVIDDDVRNIFSLTSVLEGHGMVVSSAENGNDAVAYLKQHRDVDMVLMDLVMPGMDGYETIGAIRQGLGLSALPIVVLTAQVLRRP